MLTLTAPNLADAMLAISNSNYLIGAGIDRKVYRLPDSSWVYKVDINFDCIANTQELAAYNKYKDSLPEGVKFPRMVFINNKIIAAEFISNAVDRIADKESECDFDGHHHCKNKSNCWINPWLQRLNPVLEWFTDIHGGNLRIRDNDLYIIDLGDAKS